MVYMPIVNYNGAPFVQSVKKSSDGKGIVVRVDIDGKQEGIKEEKSWFLTVEIDKELVDSCTFMTALFNRIESKTYYLNGENEESHDVWKAEFSLNIYDSGFRFRSEYASEASGHYEITDDTLTLHFAKKTG